MLVGSRLENGLSNFCDKFNLIGLTSKSERGGDGLEIGRRDFTC